MDKISLTIATLLVGSFVTYISRRNAKYVATVFTIISLGIVLTTINDIKQGRVIYVMDHISSGIYYSFALDGLSFPMLILVPVISLVSILLSYRQDYDSKYYSLLLLLQLGLIGVYAANDFILFYIFWEFVLIPAFFIILYYGLENRRYAALKFFIYTHVGSLLMLLGFILLYMKSGSFLFDDLKKTFNELPINYAKIIFTLTFIGFAFKLPVFPFHSWLPHAYIQAPTQLTILLSALVSKMGAYGMIRFSLEMFSNVLNIYAKIIAIIGIITIFYAGLLALAQDDLKALLAYSSFSHTGFIVVAFTFVNKYSISGAIFQMFSHALVAALLFSCLLLLENNIGTRFISRMGGVAYVFPLIGWTFVFAGLAGMGLPSLSSFVAEYLILLGVISKSYLFALLLGLSIGLTTGYISWFLQRAIFNPVREEFFELREKVYLPEILSIAILVILIIYFGLYPKDLVEILLKYSEVIM